MNSIFYYTFDLDQQIGGAKPRRAGVVLGFEGFNDADKPVLACNSLELSPA
ncbi:MAG: hypothetical protein GF334_07445 [Candidatus Altiarchaeales archaeon]|nr:hypothetical protein [Candidatus Altiarchaeales archaeon]